MKRILMIGTGGTIASGKTAEGLMPELTSEQLLSFVPAVSSLCRAECLQLLSLDSTNLAPTHWLLIAKAIRERYDRYDGFVIGLPKRGVLRELLSSDAEDFGGTGIRNAPEIRSEDVPFGALPCSARVTLPPLSSVYFTYTNR